MRHTILLALLVSAVTAATANAGTHRYTPRQAYRIVAHCMTHAGAKHVVNRHAHGGTAWFTRPYTIMGTYISWSYATSGGHVDGLIPAYTRHPPRGKVNACLHRYGWRI